ncbi:unnamed protein product [Musa banksii]
MATAKRSEEGLPCPSFSRRCRLLVREQKARFYILRRCIMMLKRFHVIFFIRKMNAEFVFAPTVHVSILVSDLQPPLQQFTIEK